MLEALEHPLGSPRIFEAKERGECFAPLLKCVIVKISILESYFLEKFKKQGHRHTKSILRSILLEGHFWIPGISEESASHHKYILPSFKQIQSQWAINKLFEKSKNTFRCTSVSGRISTAPVCRTGGKPSTWFPPVGLVELYVHRFFK